MNLEIIDREATILLTALELLRDTKSRAIIGTPEEQAAFKKINPYDLLAPQHTLMGTMALMSKITKKPVEYFSQNPSQNKQPATHEQPKPKPSTAP